MVFTQHVFCPPTGTQFLRDGKSRHHAADINCWPRSRRSVEEIPRLAKRTLRLASLRRARVPETLVHLRLSTVLAFSRRNFGHTSSLNGTLFISVMMRSSERPKGK